MSKRMLWPTITASRANSRNAGSTSSIRGAGSTIASVMPVSTVIIGGIGTPGFTSVSKRPSSSPPRMLHRADLGDRVVVPGDVAGGLEVDDHERDLRQRRAEVVERLLAGRDRRAGGAVSKPDSTGAYGEVGATGGG